MKTRIEKYFQNLKRIFSGQSDPKHPDRFEAFIVRNLLKKPRTRAEGYSRRIFQKETNLAWKRNKLIQKILPQIDLTAVRSLNKHELDRLIEFRFLHPFPQLGIHHESTNHLSSHQIKQLNEVNRQIARDAIGEYLTSLSMGLLFDELLNLKTPLGVQYTEFETNPTQQALNELVKSIQAQFPQNSFGQSVRPGFVFKYLKQWMIWKEVHRGQAFHPPYICPNTEYGGADSAIKKAKTPRPRTPRPATPATPRLSSNRPSINEEYLPNATGHSLQIKTLSSDPEISHVDNSDQHSARESMAKNEMEMPRYGNELTKNPFAWIDALAEGIVEGCFIGLNGLGDSIPATGLKIIFAIPLFVMGTLSSALLRTLAMGSDELFHALKKCFSNVKYLCQSDEVVSFEGEADQLTPPSPEFKLPAAENKAVVSQGAQLYTNLRIAEVSQGESQLVPQRLPSRVERFKKQGHHKKASSVTEFFVKMKPTEDGMILEFEKKKPEDTVVVDLERRSSLDLGSH